MEALIKCKNYAFCLNKLKEKKMIPVRNPIADIGETYLYENFYDALINRDKRINSSTKILNKIKKETIKECVYTNVKIPEKWKIKIGFNTFVNKIISNDDNFLYYLSLEPKNDNNKNKRNRRQTVFFSLNDKNNILKIPSLEINKSRNNTLQLLNTKQKMLRSNSLINLDIAGKYTSSELLKNNGLKSARNFLNSSMKTDKRLIKPEESKKGINLLKKIEHNLIKENIENNKEKYTTPVNYYYTDRLTTLKFKKRIKNIRNCLYSNFQSSEQNNSTGTSKSTKMIKNNSVKYLNFKK